MSARKVTFLLPLHQLTCMSSRQDSRDTSRVKVPTRGEHVVAAALSCNIPRHRSVAVSRVMPPSVGQLGTYKKEAIISIHKLHTLILLKTKNHDLEKNQSVHISNVHLL